LTPNSTKKSKDQAVTYFKRYYPGAPLEYPQKTMKQFHPDFTVKDILGYAVTIIILTMLTLKEPYVLRDPKTLPQQIH
jgi:hypothetical protein